MTSDDTRPVSGWRPDAGSSVPSDVSETDAEPTPDTHRAPDAKLNGHTRSETGTDRADPTATASDADLAAAAADADLAADADPASAADPEAMAGSIARLAESDLDAGERRQLLGRLAGQLRRRGVSDTFKPAAAMRWVADALGDVVPHLPVRDIDTLRRHFPGMTDDEIADRLVRNASRATAAIGATGGGIAAIEWVATPTLLTAPVVLAAETVAVVAVEVKLIGELHETYGSPIPGSRSQRGVALLTSWAHRRGVNPMMPGVGVAAVLGTAARKELRDRLLRRFGRNLTSYGPMLTGAAVASYLNRRATLTLADAIRRDLRDKRRKVIDG